MTLALGRNLGQCGPVPGTLLRDPLQEPLLVLGLLIEKVTGKPLGAELRSRTYRPFGMTGTSFQNPATGSAGNLGHHEGGVHVCHRLDH